MSIRHAFLALLSKGPKHGYELKTEYEELFGGMLDVNAGQIYTTLSRLWRDGLVVHQRVEQEDRPDKKIYSLTAEGQDEIDNWLQSNVCEDPLPKDELLIKLLILRKVNSPGAKALIWKQRQTLLDVVRQLVKLRSENLDVVRNLILDRAILRQEADLKWLDICEEMLP